MKKHFDFFPCWKNREEDLKKVKRYHKFKIMFYRTDLLIHYKRVSKFVEIFLPDVLKVYPKINPKLTRSITFVHDDYEMVSKRGDIPLQFKLQLAENGNDKELSDILQEEIVAINSLSKYYKNPKINGYYYKDLLMSAVFKNCPEAQLHSFCDKIDGYCEAIHEVLAGNIGFLEPVINYLMKTFSNPAENFPLIKEVFLKKNGLFSFPVVDLLGYFEKGRIGAFFHTPETIMNKKTEIPHYELWKEITLSMPNGMEILTRQTEFHLNQKSAT